ncbi:dioxygenase family protein [Gallaecimonas mangrovi]|uniref:dioxygenase family protein n=1 Tax=Gallaecimonas mangrovi TaxID=2291597 RepID=UPI000E1FFA3B|nr:class III extradiol ring-cleavage dioxygenase [Gallaecimonas mangrovi]
MTPVLFVSHGAPTFALEPGKAGPLLRGWGKTQKPSAVVVVSPHWMTQGAVAVTSAELLPTIHDFGGFAPALYQLQYPAKGDPGLAHRVQQRLKDAGLPAIADNQRGLDHGAWVPLMHLFPKADVPVVQVSMPYPLDANAAFALGRALLPLRKENVLLVASGSLTHNLYEFRQRETEGEDYVRRFANWVETALRHGNDAALMDLYNQCPDARRAHPTPDHYLPLIIAMGAREKAEAVKLLDGGIAHGVLSMNSFIFGDNK